MIIPLSSPHFSVCDRIAEPDVEESRSPSSHRAATIPVDALSAPNVSVCCAHLGPDSDASLDCADCCPAPRWYFDSPEYQHYSLPQPVC